MKRFLYITSFFLLISMTFGQNQNANAPFQKMAKDLSLSASQQKVMKPIMRSFLIDLKKLKNQPIPRAQKLGKYNRIKQSVLNRSKNILTVNQHKRFIALINSRSFN